MFIPSKAIDLARKCESTNVHSSSSNALEFCIYWNILDVTPALDGRVHRQCTRKHVTGCNLLKDSIGRICLSLQILTPAFDWASVT